MILNVLRERLHILSSKVLFLVIDYPFLSLVFFLNALEKVLWTCSPRVSALSYFSCKPFMPLTGIDYRGVSIQILPFIVYISCLHFHSCAFQVLCSTESWQWVFSTMVWQYVGATQSFQEQAGEPVKQQDRVILVLAVQDSSSAQILCLPVISGGSGDDWHIRKHLQYRSLTSAAYV